MSEQIVETLLVERGLKYDETGEAIASYNRSIVFLPKGAVPGQKVRVILQEIPGKTDRRGRPMYETDPAPVEYSERWKDNGDGTASKLTIQTDWLGKETVWDEGEPKKLETHDGTARSHTYREVVWGSNLTDSHVDEVEMRIIPVESEVVKNGALSWEKTSEREEVASKVQYPINEIGMPGSTTRLQVKYEPNWTLQVRAHYQLTPDSPQSHAQTFTWGELPDWVKTELESQYPVCSCGRQRRDVQVADGYAKCELCRAEETCSRCGKQAKVSVVNGHLVCGNCQPYEAAEQLIVVHLTDVHRQAIADEAKKLLAGQALEGELGLAVLKVGLGHVSSDYTRGRISNRWSGYQYYYFTDGGVFGTKLAPAALAILEFLPQATGNGLVEMVAWVTGGPKATRDYYQRTQVDGEAGVKLSLTDDFAQIIAGKLEAGQPALAERLRGSEQERLAALEAFAKAEAELAGYQYGTTIYNLMSETRQALQNEEQNYQLVLEKIAKVFAEHSRQEVLNDLLAQEYASCPVCGEELSLEDRRDSHYCQKQDELRAKGQYQTFVVKDSCVGEVALVSLVAVCDGRYNEYELQLEVNRNAVVDGPDAVETRTYWREPSARERELAEELGAAQVELVRLKDELEQVGRFNRVLVTFQAGVDPKDQPQLQAEGVFTGSVQNRKAENGYSEYTDQKVLFVCRQRCDWLEEQSQAGQTWVATIAFQIGVDRKGKPIIVVNPQVRIDAKAELETKIVRLGKELAALPAQAGEAEKVDAFDDEGNPQTAMAAAFAEAGIV